MNRHTSSSDPPPPAPLPTPIRAALGPCIAAAALLVGGGCGPPATSDAPEFPGADAVCSDGTAIPSAGVEPRHTTLGPSSNAIRSGGEAMWIVVSGSNSVARLDPDSGRLQQDFIDVGNDRNPYDLTVDGAADRVFVTNWLADTVTVADASTGDVVAEIDDPAFDAPEGIAHTDAHLYVANAHFTGGDVPFETGTVSVVDRETREVVATAETAAKNPQFVRRIDTPDGPRVAVVSSGVIDIDDDGTAQVTSHAALELWTPGGDGQPTERRIFELEAGPDGHHGAPGRPLPGPDGRYLYFTSATAPVVFKFDMHPDSTGWVRDTSNPIRLYEADGNALHHGTVGPEGRLWVTAFNRDALWVVDTRCDRVAAGPISLGRSPDLLEGPHGIVFDKTGGSATAYYILSPAHALGRLTFR